MVKPGIYQHFKGHKYKVVAIAKHSESLEDLVVYQNIEKEQEVWVRPLAMFLEEVDIDGHKVPRFKFIE